MLVNFVFPHYLHPFQNKLSSLEQNELQHPKTPPEEVAVPDLDGSDPLIT
jgi:hypothetical protein